MTHAKFAYSLCVLVTLGACSHDRDTNTPSSTAYPSSPNAEGTDTSTATGVGNSSADDGMGGTATTGAGATGGTTGSSMPGAGAPSR